MLITEIDMRGRDIFQAQGPYKKITRNFSYQTSKIEPLNIKTPIYVANDPSKTEGALLIGDEYGSILKIYTTSAVYEDGREDTTSYCEDLRAFHLQLLEGSNILVYSKEATIMKDGSKFYHSMKVLESISKTLQDVANQLTGRDAFEINNWTWKSSILPDGYRSRKEKGSLRWLSDLNFYNKALGDNITDVVCMYLHLVKTLKKQAIVCNALELTSKKYSYYFMPKAEKPDGAFQFVYNKRYPLINNISYYLNRRSGIGWCDIDVNDLLQKDLLGHCQNIYPDEPEVILLVKEE